MSAKRKAPAAAAESQERLVWVEWLRDAPLPVPGQPGLRAENGFTIGNRRYGGRVGERQQVPLEVWRVLSGAGFVKQVNGPTTEEV